MASQTTGKTTNQLISVKSPFRLTTNTASRGSIDSRNTESSRNHNVIIPPQTYPKSCLFDHLGAYSSINERLNLHRKMSHVQLYGFWCKLWSGTDHLQQSQEFAQRTNLVTSLVASFIGPTWGPSGADRTQVVPMLAPWNLPSGITIMS